MTSTERTNDHQRLPSDAPARPSGIRIDLQLIGAAHGAIVTVIGEIGDDDAAVVERNLHAVLGGSPNVVVVNLSGVPRCAPGGVRVLAAARDHARSAGIDLHLVHLKNPDARAWLNAAHLAS